MRSPRFTSSSPLYSTRRNEMPTLDTSTSYKQVCCNIVSFLGSFRFYDPLFLRERQIRRGCSCTRVRTVDRRGRRSVNGAFNQDVSNLDYKRTKFLQKFRRKRCRVGATRAGRDEINVQGGLRWRGETRRAQFVARKRPTGEIGEDSVTVAVKLLHIV